MKLNFVSYDNQDDSELLCPNCGSNYIYHNKVEIFDRNEDSDYDIHVIVSAGKSITDNSMEVIQVIVGRG